MLSKKPLTPKDLSDPKVLDENDDVSRFVCGINDIDDFIRKEALIFQEQSLGITYVFKYGSELIGFTTLCMGHLNKQKMAAEDRLPKSIKSYPALLIGQLAVSANHQTKHVGTHICDFCFDRAVRLAKILGCRFLVVDSVEKAVKFYEGYGFVLAPKQEKEKQKLMWLDITKRKKKD